MKLATLTGIVLGMLLGLVIFFSPFFKNKANRMLAAFIWTVTILGINERLLYGSWANNEWIILIYDIMWEYLFPVFFLLYFIYALDHPLGKQARRYWLFLPFVFTSMMNILINLDVDFGFYTWTFVENKPALRNYYVGEHIMAFVWVLGVSIYAYFIIQNKQTAKSKGWFWQLWILTNVVILCWIILSFLDLMNNQDYQHLLWVGISVAFFWIIYEGVSRFKLAEDQFEVRAILARGKSNEPVPNEADSTLSLHLQRLEHLMKKEHLYRNPEINREIIAAKLGISPGYLSQQLNASFQLNFSEYLNAFRIEEIKRMLLNPEFDSYSLVSIGLEAGFNSKSAFYTAFKKATGLTPTAFRLKHQVPIKKEPLGFSFHPAANFSFAALQWVSLVRILKTAPLKTWRD